MTRFLAIHGMKRRRTAVTIEQGLVRDSAAWFVLARRPGVAAIDNAELDRTLAAATYLALGPATRERLAGLTRPGSYADYLGSAEGLVPAVLLFVDEPTGRETWHRYAWTGPPSPGTTGPYTKVARAGRRVLLRDRATHVVALDGDMLATAEAVAERAEPVGRPLLELPRIPEEATAPAVPAGGSGDKLTRFCAALAAQLRPEAAAHARRLLTGGSSSAGSRR
jgi:hypothetical protein